MKYSELFGEDIQADIAAIKRELDEDAGTVFVYSGPGTLYDYITDLNDRGRGLDDEYLYRFRVCYEKKDLYVSYYSDRANGKLIGSMSELAGELDGESPCRIVVEADDRSELADVIQQLIYLGYPLETVDILLRREEEDADKAKRFMDRVGELMNDCDAAVLALTELQQQVRRECDGQTKAVRLQDVDEALASCRIMREQIADALNVELKCAVAASKNTGKSVIVNCFLGEEIAPTGVERPAPNNCTYKRSSGYALQLEGEETINRCETREELHSAIEECFQTARNSRETGFALPDMQIQYVTGENNFSSYTIFDTAGPDAAGTDHEEAAKEAMRKCDVAVFVIDYTRSLTGPEASYLREMKPIFAEQNKFHSLIFALNKTDMRYTGENAPRSVILAADLVKARLTDIDEAYRNCIIFPTSSQEYFHTMEAEKAGIAELESGVPAGGMRQLSLAHKDVPALQWLHSYSEYLDYYQGVGQVSCGMLREDSGMPALMNYVSYVARSKMRDDLINSIAAQIAAQKVKVQGVLDLNADLEALIRADDENIQHISKIISEYTESVEGIFTRDCNQDDLAVLEENNILGLYDGVYENMIDHQEEALKAACEVTAIAGNIYNVVVDTIWDRLCEKIREKGDVTGREINALFTATDFNTVVSSVIKDEAERNAGEIQQRMSRLQQEVEQIAAHRRARLEEASRKCSSALSKENVEIQLPDPPAFGSSTQMPPPEESPVDVYQANLNLFHDLGYLFEKKFFANIGVWFLNLLRFNKVAEEDYKLTLRASIADFQIACDKYLRSDIVNAVYTYRIPEKIYKPLKSSVVEKYLRGLVAEFRGAFNEMNETYKACSARFREAVDERDTFNADISLQEQRKDTIHRIERAVNDLLSTWHGIVFDFSENAEQA